MLVIAETIGAELGLPVQSVPAETLGLLGQAFALDQPSSSSITRHRFAWQPTHPSLLGDLRSGN